MLSFLLLLGLGCSNDKSNNTSQDSSPNDTETELDTETNTDTGIEMTCSEEDLTTLYTQYVEPFVSGTVSSSCSECHMTGIDISLYAQDTPCETMACMVESQMVDFNDPESSTLLEQIHLGDPNSSVYDLEAEYEAMLEWILWSSACHDELCDEIESPCAAGTGSSSTGQNPIGNCSEQDLLASFWDALIIDQQRCVSCHTISATEAATHNSCTIDDECEGNQQCLDGYCRLPGPYFATNFFEGEASALHWNIPEEKQLGLNTMYNVIALGFLDTDDPLQSTLLTKPLLENFQPTQIYGSHVSLPSVSSGMGVYHGGSSKFNFGCHQDPCPTEGIVDCRREQECHNSNECGDSLDCIDGYCRISDSVCDRTYVNLVRFATYFADCK